MHAPAPPLLSLAISNAHRMKHLSFSFAVAVVVALAASAMSIAPLPTRADVAGVWIGEGIRLELDTNGTGYFCQSFSTPNTDPWLYRVPSWTLSNWSITLKTRPLDDAPPRTFGKLQYSDGILLGDLDKQKIRFYKEAQWQSIAKQIRERIARERKPHR